jgi:hypothetical protein
MTSDYRSLPPLELQVYKRWGVTISAWTELGSGSAILSTTAWLGDAHGYALRQLGILYAPRASSSEG